MKLLVLALYVDLAYRVLEKQSGLTWVLGGAFFYFIIWWSRKEDEAIELKEQEKHEEIIEILRDIRLNLPIDQILNRKYGYEMEDDG